jgi:pseudouridine kinase
MAATDSEKPVLVIGTAGLDMVGRLAGEPEAGTSTPASIRLAFGGVARNVAENLARLGQSCILISAVGDDLHGNDLRTELETAGVDISGVRVVEGACTGAYLAIVDPQGSLRLALDDMTPLQSLTPEILQGHEALFEKAGMVFFDANLAAESITAVVRLAQKAGVPIGADPTSRHLAERLLPHLRKLHLVTPSVGEAEVLLEREIPRDDPSAAVLAARDLVGRGVKVAIISLSEFGVAYASRDQRGYVPALRTVIVDPTGAGDALTAAVLFALQNDIPLDEAVKLGITAASLTLRSKKTVVPDLTLERLYEEMM